MCATKYRYSPVKVTRIQTENIEGGVKHKKVLLNKRVNIKTETKQERGKANEKIRKIFWKGLRRI